MPPKKNNKKYSNEPKPNNVREWKTWINDQGKEVDIHRLDEEDEEYFEEEDEMMPMEEFIENDLEDEDEDNPLKFTGQQTTTNSFLGGSGPIKNVLQYMIQEVKSGRYDQSKFHQQGARRGRQENNNNNDDDDEEENFQDLDANDPEFMNAWDESEVHYERQDQALLKNVGQMMNAPKTKRGANLQNTNQLYQFPNQYVDRDPDINFAGDEPDSDDELVAPAINNNNNKPRPRKSKKWDWQGLLRKRLAEYMSLNPGPARDYARKRIEAIIQKYNDANAPPEVASYRLYEAIGNRPFESELKKEEAETSEETKNNFDFFQQYQNRRRQQLQQLQRHHLIELERLEQQQEEVRAEMKRQERESFAEAKKKQMDRKEEARRAGVAARSKLRRQVKPPAVIPGNQDGAAAAPAPPPRGKGAPKKPPKTAEQILLEKKKKADKTRKNRELKKIDAKHAEDRRQRAKMNQHLAVHYNVEVPEQLYDFENMHTLTPEEERALIERIEARKRKELESDEENEEEEEDDEFQF